MQCGRFLVGGKRRKGRKGKGEGEGNIEKKKKRGKDVFFFFLKDAYFGVLFYAFTQKKKGGESGGETRFAKKKR